MNISIDSLQRTSALSGGNVEFIESLYERYLLDPDAVSSTWRLYFDSMRTEEGPHGIDITHINATPAHWEPSHPSGRNDAVLASDSMQAAVLNLITAYREQGHQLAHLDPLQLREYPPVTELQLAYHGLKESDKNVVFNTGFQSAPGRMSLDRIIVMMAKTYCGPIGSEYMHISNTIAKCWIQKRLEIPHAASLVSAAEKRWVLQLITAAEGIEKFLHNRYVGQKRFSLEGGECLIPMLDQIIQHAGGHHGIQEIVIAMAHRGRLNVLVNIMGKPPALLFEEFEGKLDSTIQSGSGDVKYHQGFSSDVATAGGPVHLAMAFNPAHLEIIGPVAQGSVYARQQRRRQQMGRKVIPIMIHGDAAFAGQGVIMETFNMSQTRGFGTGGTVHIVINNQIGFTTSNPLDMRSTFYCTEVAKMVQAPIFHVNGDDPVAVHFITRIALDFCIKFAVDVVIDLVCYRRLGHNEADEPSMTQPSMYKKIRQHPTTRELFAMRLVGETVITAAEARSMVTAYRQALTEGRSVRPTLQGINNPFGVDWTPYFNADWDDRMDTAVAVASLRELAARLKSLPQGFELHPRLAKLLASRNKMVTGTVPVDWGCAETLAYASLVKAGYSVRLSGQDCARGTFSHRHAVLHSQNNGEQFMPLQHITRDQGNFNVIDSLLSEEAVLAFEYGYSTTAPNTLTIWEAQFGDFANGAQVVIDQFISSGEVKWGRLSGLVMLLPHGYEGQGPEHSSARMERYLQLCAENNMQLCVPTTPTQVFHLLRRQLIRPYRKPLIVMSGKSLLRHRQCVSRLEDLSQGRFQPVIDEIDDFSKQKIQRLIVCAGKIYYDLLEARSKLQIDNTALIRIEQLYPFPMEYLQTTISSYSQCKELIWCQEEPQNQGAWDQIKDLLRETILNKHAASSSITLRYVGRQAAAASAVGSNRLHHEQQQQLIATAFTDALRDTE